MSLVMSSRPSADRKSAHKDRFALFKPAQYRLVPEAATGQRV
jgi:hypothetical protein